MSDPNPPEQSMSPQQMKKEVDEFVKKCGCVEVVTAMNKCVFAHEELIKANNQTELYKKCEDVANKVAECFQKAKEAGLYKTIKK